MKIQKAIKPTLFALGVFFLVQSISAQSRFLFPTKNKQENNYSKIQQVYGKADNTLRKSEKIYLDSVRDIHFNGFVHIEYHYSYDKTINKMVLSEENENDILGDFETFEYNQNGNLLRENHFERDSVGNPFLTFSTSIDYSDTLVSLYSEFSIEETGDTSSITVTKPFYHNEYMYLDSVFVSNYTDSNLVFENSSNYYRDQNNRLSQIDLVYSENNHVSKREVIEYDQSGNIIREEEYKYREDSAKLKLYKLKTYEYNIDGWETSFSFHWGNTLEYKINLFYIDGFLSEFDYLEPDWGNNLVAKIHVEVASQSKFPRSKLVYDEDRTSYLPASSNPGALRKLDYYYREAENDPYELDYSLEYYWSDIATSIKENSKPISVSVFPNPSSDYIQFDIASRKASFEIYTSEGKLKMAGTTTKNLQIDISNFPAGVYHYTLNLGGTKGTGSFVKK